MSANRANRSIPNRRQQWWLALFLLGLALALGSLTHTVLAQQEDDSPTGLVLTLEGAIGLPPWTMWYGVFAAPNPKGPSC